MISRTERLVERLRRLIVESPQIEVAELITVDGWLVAYTNVRMDPELWPAICASLFSIGTELMTLPKASARGF
jgi:hypothetical protein